LLAGTIAGPVRRLADSAERVRRRIKTRGEIPDFTRRRDEIGHLSGALRDMTDALYNRIEAIEMFAADVAHELKNPLTSLRSAVETLPLARNEHSRSRLLAVIEHDVKRLDRLISDISDASRLDAELQRQDMEPVDLRRLLTTLVSVANETRLGHDVTVEARFEGRGPADTFSVPGHDSRLGQVISNLLSNAQSFSSAGGKVRITCRRGRVRWRGDDCRCPLRGQAAGAMTDAGGSSIHASAVRVGNRGVLIRGPSGSGKSRLAFDLITSGRSGQIAPAILVGDDRVHLDTGAGQLRVRTAPELAGLIEIRGLGIRRCEFAEE